MSIAAATTSPTGVDTLLGVLGLIGIVIAYWAPTVVALVRHIPAAGQVVVVNLFLGWTVIGWVVALVMALRAVPDVPAATR